MMTPREKVLAGALLTVLVALLLVGVVSGTILRHAVQVLPLLAAAVVVVMRPAWSRSAAMPVLAFWLFVMLLIWSYLLGLTKLISGKFTAAEIMLTVVMGIACVAGLVASAHKTTRSAGWWGVAAFLIFAALQFGAMWLSMHPAIANR